jgi:hypothetical protein
MEQLSLLMKEWLSLLQVQWMSMTKKHRLVGVALIVEGMSTRFDLQVNAEMQYAFLKYKAELGKFLR